MRVLRYTSRTYRSQIAKLDRRAAPSDAVRNTVTEILAGVEKDGDKALIGFAKKFDRAVLTAKTLRVSKDELAVAKKQVDAATKKLLKASHDNVLEFARKSLRKDWSGTNAQGASVGEIYQGFERVGCYIPGGSAPLVSTAIMTCTLAKAAGCPEIVACTPCGPDGTVHPALLCALTLAGATEIYKVGGAQAIAAMAYGTKSIAPVVKVFGPGNQFVVEAKRQVFGTVAVDLLPGPSEVLVVADKTGRADFIAADLLAQAEHGGDSGIGFVTDSETLLEDVQAEIKRQVKELSRQDQLQAVLKAGAFLILAESMDEAIDICNAYSPEHVTLIAKRENTLMAKIRTAGAIFLGNLSPVAVGDFLAGPSHELPTGGAGKSFPGLTVDQFQRRTSIVRLDQASIGKSAPIVDAFARIEGLDAHARSVTIRVEGS